MCSAKTAGRRKFVRVRWKLTLRTKSMPRKGQSENSAKRRRFATGRFTPTESRSAKPIFRPENSSRISGGNRALDRRAGQAKTFGHRLVGDMAAVNIQTRQQMGVLLHRRKAMV